MRSVCARSRTTSCAAAKPAGGHRARVLRAPHAGRSRRRGAASDRHGQEPSLRRAARASLRSLQGTAMNHLDEDAELYALGLTEPERSAEIEAHVAACADCRDRVVAAEATAASLAATLPPMTAAQRRSAWWARLATAAAVVFAAAAAFEGYAAHAAGAQLARTDVALSALAGSHFGH